MEALWIMVKFIYCFDFKWAITDECGGSIYGLN